MLVIHGVILQGIEMSQLVTLISQSNPTIQFSGFAVMYINSCNVYFLIIVVIIYPLVFEVLLQANHSSAIITFFMISVGNGERQLLSVIRPNR